MKKEYVEDETFEKRDFTENMLPKGEYENCVFIHCNFASSDLSRTSFSECQFINCNLSLANLTNTVFRDIKFRDCKLVGLHFNHCDAFLFTVDFDHCLLHLSSFYKRKLKKTHFENSILREVDFTETDLTSALFDNCDLSGATFEDTILEKADFRTSYNYSIHPQTNKIKKAKFSMAGIAGLLDRYDIEIE
jgi:fluoroquinolone resistance protein